MPVPPKILKDYYDKPELQNNCSGFFTAVAQRLGVQPAAMRADELIDKISDPSSQWIGIGKGADNGRSAANYAKQGYLVVALLKAKDHYPFKYDEKTKKYDIPHPYSHGHMAIVIPADPDEDGYPYLICGSIVAAGKSDGSKSVHGVWRGIDAPNVQYYYWPTKFPDLIKSK
jgi:hypothetical protein